MRQEEEDLVILTKAEYEALGKELARAHMINLRYQARCTCKIDFKTVITNYFLFDFIPRSVYMRRK